MVRDVVGDGVALEVVPTDDPRSYHVSSARIKAELGFEPTRSIEDAVRDLVQAFREDRLPEAMSHPRYYNIKTMQAIDLR